MGQYEVYVPQLVKHKPGCGLMANSLDKQVLFSKFMALGKLSKFLAENMVEICTWSLDILWSSGVTAVVRLFIESKTVSKL